MGTARRSAPLLLALSALTLSGACGGPAPPRAATPAAAEPADAPPERPASARPPPGPPLVAFIEAPEGAGGPTAQELADAPAPPGEPPEYTALKARALRGDVSPHLLKDLQKLGSKYPKQDELAYLLTQLYFSKLWVGDGLKTFRRAIALNPAYRMNPYLLRAAINGLGNDRDSAQVRAFLLREIGEPAGPYLEEVIYGDFRQQVKDRAAAILRELK